MSDYSVVIPVYFNVDTLEQVVSEIVAKVLPFIPGKTGEIICVDDGSKDRSFEVLELLHRKFPDSLRVFKLSRNYGQVNAVWCGMKQASGAVLITAADGQEPTSAMVEMLNIHFQGRKEVVIARRESRQETFFRRFSSKITYWLMRKLAHADMPVGGFDFLVLGSQAKDALLSVYQPNTFFQHRVLELGFERAWIGYHRRDRLAGISRWTFSKKLTYMIDGVLGHSYFPIRAMSFLGCLFSGLSFLGVVFFLSTYFLFGSSLRGFTPIVLLILFLGGLQMLMIGVIGEYVWRVLAQVRNSPPYIIEKVLEK